MEGNVIEGGKKAMLLAVLGLLGTGFAHLAAFFVRRQGFEEGPQERHGLAQLGQLAKGHTHAIKRDGSAVCDLLIGLKGLRRQ